MSSPIRISKEFVKMFDRIIAHYECPEDEIPLMKDAVRRDIEGAKECYAAMCRELDGGLVL